LPGEKPKKAMTPYLCFVKLNRKRIGDENVGMKFAEIMQEISKVWASITEKDKEVYV
jgi:hypothetical protein